MAKILIRLAYDGTGYSGFQLQKNGLTIQGELEKALALIYKKPLHLEGAGRTDAGVHAQGQAAAFIAPFQIPLESLPHALNSALPADIIVSEAMEVPHKFHPRHDAAGKVYSYTIDRAFFAQVFLTRYSLHLPDPLDLCLLEQAACIFEGQHDFSRYCAVGSDVKDKVRTIASIAVNNSPEQKLLVIRFTGSGFLYRMVRLITGSLIRAASGKLTIEKIAASLAGAENDAPGPTVPAKGLCLEEVIYENMDLNLRPA